MDEFAHRWAAKRTGQVRPAQRPNARAEIVDEWMVMLTDGMRSARGLMRPAQRAYMSQ